MSTTTTTTTTSSYGDGLICNHIRSPLLAKGQVGIFGDGVGKE